MKKILAILTLAALSATTFAAKKEAAAPAAKPAETKPAEGKAPEAKPAAAPATPAAKAMGMFVKVDTIDAKAKTFTHKNKDETVVKFMVTDTTEIKNGDVAAKLEDIKVGDTVSGSRIKKSPTEYEVVKITKFGVKEAKAVAPEAKPAATEKPEAKKK